MISIIGHLLWSQELSAGQATANKKEVPAPQAYTGGMQTSKQAGELSPVRPVQVAMGTPGQGRCLILYYRYREWGVVKEELEL